MANGVPYVSINGFLQKAPADTVLADPAGRSLLGTLIRINDGAFQTRRPKTNVKAGANISLSINDDSGDDEIELTIAVTGISTPLITTGQAEVGNISSGGSQRQFGVTFDAIVIYGSDAGGAGNSANYLGWAIGFNTGSSFSYGFTIKLSNFATAPSTGSVLDVALVNVGTGNQVAASSSGSYTLTNNMSNQYDYTFMGLR